MTERKKIKVSEQRPELFDMLCRITYTANHIRTMNVDNFSQFFSKKAYEIGYAAFKIGSVVKFQAFGDHLFNRAFSLLDLAGKNKYADCKSIAESLEFLLRFGCDVGIVHTGNFETMTQEIRQFNSAIAEYEELIRQPEIVNLEGSFSRIQVSSSFENKKSDSLDVVSSEIHKIQDQKINYNVDSTRHFKAQEESVGGTAKSAIRQSAILEIIRQNGNLPDHRENCRLKDIQESLGDVSDRTIRYDLQDLIERGFIERIGNGGPATYYKIRKTEKGEEVMEKEVIQQVQ